LPNQPVTNISAAYNVALITVDNIPNNIRLISNILNSIAEDNINIDMISQAPPYKGSINLSFSLPSEDLIKAISALNAYKRDIPDLHIEVDAANTKLSVYGEGMKNIPGVAAKLFTVLAQNSIDIKLVTTSEVDISFLVYDRDVDRAIEAIKSEFYI